MEWYFYFTAKIKKVIVLKNNNQERTQEIQMMKYIKLMLHLIGINFINRKTIMKIWLILMKIISIKWIILNKIYSKLKFSIKIIILNKTLTIIQRKIILNKIYFWMMIYMIFKILKQLHHSQKTILNLNSQ